MCLSDEAKQDMVWWGDNIMPSCNVVDESYGDPDLVIQSGASLTVWGCSCVEGMTDGHRRRVECQAHINVFRTDGGSVCFKHTSV